MTAHLFNVRPRIGLAVRDGIHGKCLITHTRIGDVGRKPSVNAIPVKENDVIVSVRVNFHDCFGLLFCLADRPFQFLLCKKYDVSIPKKKEKSFFLLFSFFFVSFLLFSLFLCLFVSLFHCFFVSLFLCFFLVSFFYFLLFLNFCGLFFKKSSPVK